MQLLQAQIPDVAHIIAGDVGDDHSMNFLFVMGLREVGIPARCLHGLLLQSCNNSTFDKTVEVIWVQGLGAGLFDELVLASGCNTVLCAVV